MKQTIAAAAATLFALVGTPSYGQTLGVSVGANTSKVVESACQVSNEPCDLDFRTGVTVGVFMPFGWGNGKAFGPGNGRYAVQPELRFTRKGGKATTGNNGLGNQGQEVNALEIVALGRVNVEVGNVKPFVVLGPSVGMVMSAKDDSGKDIKDAFKSADFQVVFGGGVQINNMIGVEARYQQSVYEIYASSFVAGSNLTKQPFNRHNNRAITFLVDVSLRK